MKLLVFPLLIVLIAACSDTRKKADASAKEKFDAIEKILGNDNWKSMIDQDTSYIYFSRIGQTLIKCYHYRIQQGDSAVFARTEITVNPNSGVVKWERVNALFVLTSVNDTIIKWQNTDAQETYTMKMIDSSHIEESLSPSNKVVMMQKTLPLATFLVRARYDYEHGTNYVDSPLVKPRKPVVVK